MDSCYLDTDALQETVDTKTTKQNTRFLAAFSGIYGLGIITSESYFVIFKSQRLHQRFHGAGRALRYGC